MANYLPVLLVSVSANTVPDDSSVSTLPRGQVDYLSHNWREEDVWRSWRNMTRQKNEIANGVRLENASWRTWWKQRNGLGTVTPETLNWLKDSDVTWLYGPLHTAVDWVPPPKPMQPGHSALDLTSPSIPTHKPILKHRSISELLTSDLPSSPIFSSTESEDDITNAPHVDQADSSTCLPRPALPHTKSDTHVTLWGSGRSFRKESPLRTDNSGDLRSGTNPINAEDDVSNSTHGSDSNSTSAPSHGHGNGQKKRHISFNTFVEQYIAIEKPNKTFGYAKGDGVNNDNNDEDEEEYINRGVAGRYPSGRHPWGYDDGYEEDAEEDSDEDPEPLTTWDEQDDTHRSTVSGSDSDSYDNDEGIGEEDGAIEEEESDGMINMRTPFSTRSKSTSARSQSTVSSTSSSSSTSTSTSISNSTSSANGSPDSRGTSRPPLQRRLSSSTASTYRPRVQHSSSSRSSSQRSRRASLIHSPASEQPNTCKPSSQSTHVTIAPIAPTILKTGTRGLSGYHSDGWVEGFGDEGGSDDGMWGSAHGVSKCWGACAQKDQSKGQMEESDGSGGQTPVELVYVPPLGSNYSLMAAKDMSREREQKISLGGGEKQWDQRRERESDGDHETTGNHKTTSEVMEDHEDGFGNDDRNVYRRRTALFSVGDDDADVEADEPEPTLATTQASDVQGRATAPTIIVPNDAYNDFNSRKGSTGDLPLRRYSSGSLRHTADAEPFRIRSESEREQCQPQSLSRSLSRSRTPSPAMISNVSLPVPSSTLEVAPVPVRRSSSTSPTYGSSRSGLLSPPPRGRASHSYQDIGQAVPQRGRSNTRTSSSLSDRDRSAHSSPLGSLSPEGIDLGNVAGAYAGGRPDRERERDRKGDKEKSRGRERPERRNNLSPEAVQDSLLRVSPASTSPVQLPPGKEELVPRLNVPTGAGTSSISSSSSSRSTSSSTILAPVAGTAAEEHMTSASLSYAWIAEERQQNPQPTPSNSPIIFMQQAPAAITTSPSPVPRPSALLQVETATRQVSPTTRIRSPLTVSAPHPVEPSTSYSIIPPRGEHSNSSSPQSPTRPDSTIVGKAVDMVSSAGVFLGLWNSLT